MFTDADLTLLADMFPTFEFRHNVWGRRMRGTSPDGVTVVSVEQMLDLRFACGHKSDTGHTWGYGTTVREAVQDALSRARRAC